MYQPQNKLFKPIKEREYLPKVSIIEYDETDPDKHEKIAHFAQRYRIPFTKHGYKQTYPELLQDIKKYEMKHIKELTKIGREKRYNLYGLFIN